MTESWHFKFLPQATPKASWPFAYGDLICSTRFCFIYIYINHLFPMECYSSFHKVGNEGIIIVSILYKNTVLLKLTLIRPVLFFFFFEVKQSWVQKPWKGVMDDGSLIFPRLALTGMAPFALVIIAVECWWEKMATMLPSSDVGFFNICGHQSHEQGWWQVSRTRWVPEMCPQMWLELVTWGPHT